MTGTPSLRQKIGAEFLGSAPLLATVVGSGIMAERLAGGSAALALLGNTMPTSTILIVLITMLGPISGAHLNPAVTLAFLLKRSLGTEEAAAYVAAQIAGHCWASSSRTQCSICRSCSSRPKCTQE